MAKSDLVALVQKAKAGIQSDAKLLNKYYNRFPHVFIVNRAAIISQVRNSTQVSGSKLSKVQALVDRYCASLYSKFSTISSNNTTYKVFGKPTDFKVLVTSSGGYNVAISAINEIKIPQQRVLQQKLSVQLAKQQQGIDLGQGGLNSVAQRSAQQAIQRFTSFPGLSQLVGDSNANSIVSITSHQKNNNKNFTISVTSQGLSRSQQWQLDHARALQKFANSVDWMQQRGSRSKNQIILSQLAKAVLLRGGKTNIKVKGKSSTSKASAIIKPRNNRPQVSSTILGKIQGSNPNWASLVAIINSKLTQKVIQNMKVPALVNRTGRFASSTRVTGVQVSKKGFPVFVFDYQRDPYDVFDSALGAAPWNTAARDPKTLIAKSIRQILKQQAIGRFYTRRL